MQERRLGQGMLDNVRLEQFLQVQVRKEKRGDIVMLFKQVARCFPVIPCALDPVPNNGFW